MSISLPNGTILAAPSHQHVSAAVTRILHLSNFSKDLKTRDLQLIFKDWDNEKGGFRIKWLDDVNALVVFADANIAKRAYLSLLLHPPHTFPPPAAIRPYDRPDAAQIIQSLAARTMGHRSSMSNALSTSTLSNLPDAFHSRGMSTSHSSNSISSVPMKANTYSQRTSRTSFSGIGGHQRNGSASASSSWGRQSLSGAFNFGGSNGGNNQTQLPTSSSTRLPTHSESSGDPSRSGSSEESNDPVIVMDGGASNGANSYKPKEEHNRRQSISADKALREVGKALGMGVTA